MQLRNAIYTDMAIAYIHKFRNEILPEEREYFCKQARKYAKKGIKLYREIEDLYNMTILEIRLSELNLLMDGNVTEWIKTSKRIANKIKEDKSERAQGIYAHILLGIVSQYCGSSAFNDCGISYKIAKKYLSEAKQIYEKLYPNNPVKKFGILKIYWMLEAACNIDINKDEQIIVELTNLLSEYRKHVEKDFYEGLFEQYALDIQNVLGVLNYRVGAHYDQNNDVCSSIGFYNNAIKYYSDSIVSLKKIGAIGSIEILNAYQNIAIVRFSLYKLNNDEKYISQNIKELESVLDDFVQIMPNSLLIAETLQNLGRCHCIFKNYESALLCYQNAESTIDNHEDPYEKIENFYWLCKSYAELFEETKDYDKASQYILKARELLTSNDYEEDSLEVLQLDEKLKILNKLS